MNNIKVKKPREIKEIFVVNKDKDASNNTKKVINEILNEDYLFTSITSVPIKISGKNKCKYFDPYIVKEFLEKHLIAGDSVCTKLKATFIDEVDDEMINDEQIQYENKLLMKGVLSKTNLESRLGLICELHKPISIKRFYKKESGQVAKLRNTTHECEKDKCKNLDDQTTNLFSQYQSYNRYLDYLGFMTKIHNIQIFWNTELLANILNIYNSRYIKKIVKMINKFAAIKKESSALEIVDAIIKLHTFTKEKIKEYGILFKFHILNEECGLKVKICNEEDDLAWLVELIEFVKEENHEHDKLRFKATAFDAGVISEYMDEGEEFKDTIFDVYNFYYYIAIIVVLHIELNYIDTCLVSFKHFGLIHEEIRVLSEVIFDKVFTAAFCKKFNDKHWETLDANLITSNSFISGFLHNFINRFDYTTRNTRGICENVLESLSVIKKYLKDLKIRNILQYTNAQKLLNNSNDENKTLSDFCEREVENYTKNISRNQGEIDLEIMLEFCDKK
ncbi:hypothetical protein H9M94_00745 [Mycoplasma sp. Pen4]|uniref:hypothetical protein n=1 Tax=Mycoplasma sp. Pen4 TaxID=640330 RepID=UPI0016541F1C|nr:hypothetical protein [Mycoplasma sp. Pen4]QNM93789.1 hypothetical protein H9M94_00745 [Mycoplasma sp. Pen4]